MYDTANKHLLHGRMEQTNIPKRPPNPTPTPTTTVVLFVASSH